MFIVARPGPPIQAWTVPKTAALIGWIGLPCGIRSISHELTEQAGRKLVPCGGSPSRTVVFYW